jgi:single-stranded-DNA-specific exonuclease
LEHVQKERLTTEDIGFFLAPLLNSAGRMDDAKYAVDFLLSANIYDARTRLERLIDFNTLRKKTEHKTTTKALAQVVESDEVIVVEGKDWHEGVVGIVAARVARHHEKPCIVLSNNGKGMLKGSGRSFGSCDLFAITQSCREHLEKFGGHQAAIGLSLSLESLEAFKKQLQENYTKGNFTKDEIDPDIVGYLPFSEISFELTTLIKKYEPYGQGNSTPKFITKNVQILQVDTMGKEGEHLRFSFLHNDIIIAGVQFKTQEKHEIGSSVDVVYTVNENHFRGNVTLQLMVEKVIVE